MAASRSPCSVVLEGGVTSAVIYASLLAQLSGSYTFRQLGGASSGAVAAAAAAAAEFARTHAAGQPSAAFDELGRFPEFLADTEPGTDTTLFRLFQPGPHGLASFRVAMAALDRSGADGFGPTAARVVQALVRHFPIAALLLALAAAGLGGIAAQGLQAYTFCESGSAGPFACASTWTAIMLLIAVGAVIALAAWALRATLRALKANHWGLCNGMTQPGFDRPALTPTLHGFFQQLAGLPEGSPLTFGDLWWGPRVDGVHVKTDERLIDLQIITSAVSLARPVRLPGGPGEDPLREFYYDPKEWRHLFPVAVMAHLAAHARPAPFAHDDGRLLSGLPEPALWPVLMAARFSLSFPLLLSALPMYIAVPRREMLRAGDAAQRPHFEARQVYFSDGGITSNCPVHLFDAPLPRFPTFGVNLYRLPPGAETRISRSDTRDPELEASMVPGTARWATPLPFLWAIVATMMDWRDGLQRRLPGFRERMVHVGLPPEAGGLNLAMKKRTIMLLAEQGVSAAKLLQREFATPRATGEANAWERHRWTRARTSLSALRHHLQAFVSRLDAGTPSYEALLRTATPTHHPFDGDRARQQARALAAGARDLMQTLDATDPADAMDLNAPQPQPELRLSPPW